PRPNLPSFPTRRSSDLTATAPTGGCRCGRGCGRRTCARLAAAPRLSARLLVSHWTVADAGVAHLRGVVAAAGAVDAETVLVRARSEEHTSELQSRSDLV